MIRCSMKIGESLKLRLLNRLARPGNRSPRHFWLSAPEFAPLTCFSTRAVDFHQKRAVFDCILSEELTQQPPYRASAPTLSAGSVRSENWGQISAEINTLFDMQLEMSRQGVVPDGAFALEARRLQSVAQSDAGPI